MGLGFIKEGRFAGPALIGESGELLDLRLTDKILSLFFETRRLFSGVSEPLVPLRCSSGKKSISISRLLPLERCGLPWQAERAFSPHAIGLTGDLDIAVVCFGIKFDDASESVGIYHVFELPEGIPSEVLAW